MPQERNSRPWSYFSSTEKYFCGRCSFSTPEYSAIISHVCDDQKSLESIDQEKTREFKEAIARITEGAGKGKAEPPVTAAECIEILKLIGNDLIEYGSNAHGLYKMAESRLAFLLRQSPRGLTDQT